MFNVKKIENSYEVTGERTHATFSENGKLLSGNGIKCFPDEKEDSLTFADGIEAMVRIIRSTGKITHSRGKFKEYCFNE